MKLRIDFHSTEETVMGDIVEAKGGDIIIYGPLKMELLHDGESVGEVEGYLHISEVTDMAIAAEMSASTATLGVQHGNE